MTDHVAPPADLATARLALDWAREAGELTLGYFRSPSLEIERKGDGSPVTRADREAETLLRERIGAAFPDDAVTGEEHPDRGGSSGRTWTIDPIDGTKAFSRGVGTYSNLVQMSDEHGPAVGVINLPALQESVWAARGHGCSLNKAAVDAAGAQTARSPGGELAGKVLCVTGFHGWDAAMFERVRSAGVEIRTWGDAYGYALVATARADAMFDPELEWWDLAAPSIVIAEAGGTITRRDGDSRLEVPGRDGPYGLSAIASRAGDHASWVDLLAPR